MDWASNVSISCVGGWGSAVSTEVDLFKVLGSLGGEDWPWGRQESGCMSPVPDQVRGKVLGGPLFEWASLVSQGKRIHCKCKSHGLDSWVRKILWRRECNPLQYSCLENPMDRGAWQVTVHGVARVRHDWATNPPPAPLFEYILLHRWVMKNKKGL